MMEEKRIIGETIKNTLGARRAVDTDKRDYGTLLIFAGKEGMAGAAILAAKAALRSGAGLVKVATPRMNYPMLQIAIPEAICIEEEEAIEVLDRSNRMGAVNTQRNPLGLTAIAIGPGMGTDERAKRILERVLEFGKSNPEVPLLVDADGLNLISESIEMQQSARDCNLIITPHKREAARLLGEFGKSAEYGNPREYDARRETCIKLQSKYNGVTLLKGHETLITDGSFLWINTTGNPGMATAGSGDVLTGVIGALLAQGISPLEAASAGAYIHGRAGDLAAEIVGQRSLIAGDIIDNLPKAFMEVGE